MRTIRWFMIPVLLFALLGCGLSNGIQQLQQAATNLPGELTAMPTALGAMETSAAGQSSGGSSSSSTGGLGISADNAKSVLTVTQQFTATDGTVNGQTATIVKLSSTGAAAFPNMAGFEADLIGDPTNLSQITVVIPYANDQDGQEGVGLLNVLFASFMSADVQLPFFTWMTQNYTSLKPGAQVQTTVGKLQITMKRTDTQMNLEVDPAQ